MTNLHEVLYWREKGEGLFLTATSPACLNIWVRGSQADFGTSVNASAGALLIVTYKPGNQKKHREYNVQ
jgi:hypothetical protein